MQQPMYGAAMGQQTPYGGQLMAMPQLPFPGAAQAGQLQQPMMSKKMRKRRAKYGAQPMMGQGQPAAGPGMSPYGGMMSPGMMSPGMMSPGMMSPIAAEVPPPRK